MAWLVWVIPDSLPSGCPPTVGPPRNRGYSRNLPSSPCPEGRKLSDMDRHRRFARAEDEIARLSKQGLDMVAFWRASGSVLADAVPQAVAPCCYTIDPASRLLTSHFNEEMLELPPEWLVHEYAEDDVIQLTDVARSPSGVSTLYEATGGDPSSSPRWHALMADGGDQEMVAALRTRAGEVWGGLGMFREPDRPLFDADEQAFLAAISPLMADAVRRARLIGDSADPEGPEAPGMIVLGPDWRPESISSGVESGFATCLTETGRPRGCLPLCSPSPHVQRVRLQAQTTRPKSR